MKGFTFRISPEDQKNVHRDVLLPENINFEDFHFALLDAFELEAGEMASFYLSNSQWEKNKEITLVDMGRSDAGKNTVLMQETFLFTHMAKVGDRVLYLYDFLFCKNFKIEVITVVEKPDIEPLLVNSVGKYKNDTSGLRDLILDGLEDENSNSNGKESNKKPIDVMDGFDEFDNFQDGNDDFDDPQFENIDDLDL
ncbi:MAG: hypothetical protein ACJA0Q_000656 [Saprospiraceae bacterium]|jgi:hypothetical protein